MTGNKADLEEAVRHLSSLHVCTGQCIGPTEELAMRVEVMCELADAQIRLAR